MLFASENIQSSGSFLGFDLPRRRGKGVERTSELCEPCPGRIQSM